MDRGTDFKTMGPVASVTLKMLRMRLHNKPRTGATEVNHSSAVEKKSHLKMQLSRTVYIWSDSYLIVSARGNKMPHCWTIKLCGCLRDYEQLRVIFNFISLDSNMRATVDSQ